MSLSVAGRPAPNLSGMEGDTGHGTSAKGLRAPANRVSPRARLLWTATALVQAVVPIVVLVLLVTVWDLFDMPTWGWIAVGALALAYVACMPAIRFTVHRWEATAVAVYTQSGWIGRERRVAPLARVQTVDFEQGPISRFLGLATVTVTTASAAGPVRVEGLGRAVALALVDDLTERAAADTGDAT